MREQQGGTHGEASVVVHRDLDRLRGADPSGRRGRPSHQGRRDRVRRREPPVDPFDRDYLLDAFNAPDPAEAGPADAATSIANMTLVGNSDNDGTINSDLAFWGRYAYAG